MPSSDAPRLILITDPSFGDDVIVRCVRAVARVLPRGAFAVQLRDKRRPRIALRVFASELRQVTRSVGAKLFVNGDAVVARDAGADGVHVGGGGLDGQVAAARAVVGPRAWISVAAHGDADVVRAAEGGADAVLVSPVFATRPPSLHAPSKAARGLDAIRSARRRAPDSLAVYALGGVTADNAAQCVAAGADGIALIRAVLGHVEPACSARAIHDAFARR
jgi:thiamine-phosphate pyrophosphorylase